MHGGVCVHGCFVLIFFTINGRREGAGYCPCSRILNKDLPLPNKCPPQSVIDHLRLSLLLFPPSLLHLSSHSLSFPLFSVWDDITEAGIHSCCSPWSTQSFTAFTYTSNQLSSYLPLYVSSSFLPSFSSFITCYPRELDPLRFVPEAQRYILSYLSSRFLCLSESPGGNY